MTDKPLPLHLQYRFDEPGKYEFRYIGTRMEPDPPRGIRTVVMEESDWTGIEVQPFPEARRREWIRARAREMPSLPEQLIGEAMPDLLALPDAAACRRSCRGFIIRTRRCVATWLRVWGCSMARWWRGN